MEANNYWDRMKDPFRFMEFFEQNEFCQEMLAVSDWKASPYRYAGGMYTLVDKYPEAFGNIRTMYMNWLTKNIEEAATA